MPEPPVTFRDVFAVGEYRAVYFALLVSWIGDYLARAAITVLVYQQTQSVLLSAAAFAVTYLPWLVGGPLLSALAERYPYRRVMVVCDLTRMALISILLIPGVPTAGLVGVLFLVTLGGIPAQAARSAILPLILARPRLGVAMAANATTIQAAQVIGYVTGATLAAAVHPRLAIGIDALAFAISALLIWAGVRHRPAAFGRGAAQPSAPRGRRGVPAGLRQPGAALDRAAGVRHVGVRGRAGGPGRGLGGAGQPGLGEPGHRPGADHGGRTGRLRDRRPGGRPAGRPGDAAPADPAVRGVRAADPGARAGRAAGAGGGPADHALRGGHRAA